VPAVMRATATAQNARIKAEIDMLHMAIQQYKNEYGSYPPCQNLAGVGTDWGHVHLRRLFPRMSPIVVIQVPDLMPATAMPFWLSGFTDDPMHPIVGGGARKKLFDFDESRLIMRIRDDNGFYCPPSKYGSPYIYIDSNLYKKPDGSPSTWPPSALTYQNNSGQQYTIPANAYQAERTANGTYFNPDSFQILCAGRDEKFGTDDDLSNFWPGTRKDYLDSLK
jgi:hypothetical protein